MRVEHLNCATLCPLGGARLMQGEGGWCQPARLVCHCLLVDTGDGLVLIDTGLGTSDVAAPRRRLGPLFLALTRPRLDPRETAIERIRALGRNPADVRHILITHLDLDHAGGLSDFPAATVHVDERELAAATGPRAPWWRYRSEQLVGPRLWKPFSFTAGGTRQFGFDGVQSVAGLPPDIRVVPLPGHTRGHTGVAVRTDEGWLLHAGDAFFNHGELATPPRCPPGAALTQLMDDVCRRQRIDSQRKLRALHAQPDAGVKIICSHDHHYLPPEQQ